MELQAIQNKIYEIRGQKVMLDFDLAEMYGKETEVRRAPVWTTETIIEVV